MYILVGAAFLISILTYVNWFTAASPLQLAKVARTGFIVLTLATLSFLALSGKLAGFLIGLLALLPAIGNVRQIWIKNFYSDTVRLNQSIDGDHDQNTANHNYIEPNFTRGYALEILGLEDDANDIQISDAHHRIIQLIHPDKGGSSLLAALVNRARYTLLNERESV